MGDYRSNAYANGRMQMERYYGPTSTSSNTPHDFRSYGVSYTTPSYGPPSTQIGGGKEMKFKKGKSVSKSWSLGDPEFQRKKRVATYKVYAVEGKVKGSFRKSFRWLKDRYSRVVYGWL